MWTNDPTRKPGATGRRTRVRRLVILAAVAGGMTLQHILVAAPAEPSPSPLPIPATGLPAAPRVVPRVVPPAPRPRVGGQGGGAVAPPRLPLLSAGIVRPGSAAVAVVRRVTMAVKGARLLAPGPSGPSGPSVRSATATVGDRALTAAIWRAFNAYALPYQETSALIVTVGRQFGVDPAVPAALFMHEDGDINNRVLFPAHYNWLLYNTRNPGNIKCMYDPCYQGFQVYPTYRAGILDWFRLYDHYYVDLGIHDLASFISTYCPPNVDGNGSPALYQSDVAVKAARIRAGW